jgi:hypothetical protein
MKRATIITVRRLLTGDARFRAAAVSRGFVWGPAEIAQLLMDLEDGAREQPKRSPLPERFYLGIVSVSAQQKGKPAVVVDGQQRLAAIAMFFAFARDRVDDNRNARSLDKLIWRRAMGRLPEPRLRLVNEDHGWFERHILSPGATMKLPTEAPEGGARNLLACARFMARAFAGYSMDDLYRLTDFLIENTAVVLAVSEGAQDPYRQRALPQPQPHADMQPQHQQHANLQPAYARLRPELALPPPVDLRPELRLVADNTQPELVLSEPVRQAR